MYYKQAIEAVYYTKSVQGIKKYKGIPDSYCALGLIMFKIELLYFSCLNPANQHLKHTTYISSVGNTHKKVSKNSKITGI